MNISSRFHPQGFMRDQVIHAVWFLSHLLRSAFSENQDRALGVQLANEVKILQDELHHTERVLSGYSSVITACESKSAAQVRLNESFIFVLILLCALLAYNWLKPRFRVVAPIQTVCGDTGGSSDSDTGSLPPKRPLRELSLSGPVRPSQLGKGRK